jgi:signal transduction histidine kinase
MSEQVRIETRLDNEGPAIEGDAAQTEMALVNFVLNARDAMPEGGVVTIATATREIAAQADHLPRCRYAELTVTDTGAGIPADVLNRVFEPFFTTKRAGSGTGLGLSAAYGFARQSGGDLLIDSAVGRGTTVRLLLPAAVT